jgi:hypothetical protein
MPVKMKYSPLFPGSWCELKAPTRGQLDSAERWDFFDGGGEISPYPNLTWPAPCHPGPFSPKMANKWQ